MQIKDLISALNPLKVVVDAEIENLKVESISDDSRNKETSTVFFAYNGESYDSHVDIERICKSSLSKVVVCEKELDNSINHIVVENGRAALSTAYKLFYNNPLEKYKSIAVTGTNGKTTTTYLLNSIFREYNRKSVLIGTVGAYIDDEYVTLNNTTPSSKDFYSILNEGLNKGCEYLATEISSHALSQGRIFGAKFDCSVFTNLTGDHLDFHKNMDNYFKAKSMLFDDLMSNFKVVNKSNEYGEKLSKLIKNNLITYSINNNADIYPKKYDFDVTGIKATLSVFGKDVNISSHLVGEYNLENILAAISAAYAIGIDEKAIVNGVSSLNNVSGRLEKINGNGYTVFVDYAHTDDALKNVLKTLRKIANNRIITVFGAGGDRDNTKRPRMGRIAEELSDVVVITSDNPRTEDKNKIIEDILVGIINTEAVIIEADREKAIEKAINIALKDDIILIAGKGHEDYQIIGKDKFPFDDRLIAKKYIGNGEL